MNPVAGTIMIAIAAAFFGLIYFSVAYGHPWLLATLVVAIIAAFVRWG
ncbi:DUF4175 domain-containing protein [Methylobacterium planeticum]|uniref:DUF4175 domain-containing protein n=1 Tax=Methylobacterium planeticum TaxID=2615211 RepID=A0A6N6MSH0_9HYPH|nr:DUF4175 domain-containing protein [Methylobacterium planeticum]KAB1071583.1 DUF4175 domain-containing protein [Methylobacterium planeticum]